MNSDCEMAGGQGARVRVLSAQVANKIAAGEVVERPASVVKELVENAIDAGAKSIRIAIAAGGRKLISVQDDGSGMSRGDAIRSLERQATSKIRDVGDIETISTLGFRGEAIPSIASVSRFTLTTRPAGEDCGTRLVVNAGELVETADAGCPAGTLVEVRDLFCNVPVRSKFLRSQATEEAHVRNVFTVHALAHPKIAFALTVDGREACRLAGASTLGERVREIFGDDFAESLAPLESTCAKVRVSGFIERPNRAMPSRRDQYVFVNGRPATSPSIACTMRDSYPRESGDVRAAAIVFIDLPPQEVDVNVHPTKREVRFRNNGEVRSALQLALQTALGSAAAAKSPAFQPSGFPASQPFGASATQLSDSPSVRPFGSSTSMPMPIPAQVEFTLGDDDAQSRPWRSFRYLAQTSAGDLIVETEAGLVIVSPSAARARIAYERLVRSASPVVVQPLLVPEIVRLAPADFARISAAAAELAAIGFRLEPFGDSTVKVDGVPPVATGLSVASVLATVSSDLAESPGSAAGEKWRAERIAKSLARACSLSSSALDAQAAAKLVEELGSCRMPYVSPQSRPTMFFLSNREIDRKFSRSDR